MNDIDCLELFRIKIDEIDSIKEIKKFSFIPKRKYLFLRGPIPLDWLIMAGSIPGKALHVGLLIWFLHFVKGKPELIPFSSSLFRRYGFDRTTSYRAIKGLEKANLISVIRHRGRNPLIKILLSDTMMDLPASTSQDSILTMGAK